ncbi:MAG: hypothetical protein ONB46_17365 [candidate division KSB1 bacterium]|nr:hypothetical protein [candidate division KSB1 bacterium]MDZ7367626.1 hypothetical protein [candidate division KSB1 bacterium]MDZ7405418.1 hypothetical protein [candidate division KSB1 bacterium]
MEKFLMMGLGMVVLTACHQQQPATTPAAVGLRKISATDSQNVTRLRQGGVKILVQQQDYLIVYSDSAAMQALVTNAQPATEKDLVQRLVRIHFTDKTQLQKIADLGVDIWEVEGDSVTARAYDLYLEQLKQDGFSYRILKTNASAPEGK